MPGGPSSKVLCLGAPHRLTLAFKMPENHQPGPRYMIKTPSSAGLLKQAGWQLMPCSTGCAPQAPWGRVPIPKRGRHRHGAGLRLAVGTGPLSSFCSETTRSRQSSSALTSQDKNRWGEKGRGRPTAAPAARRAPSLAGSANYSSFPREASFPGNEGLRARRRYN